MGGAFYSLFFIHLRENVVFLFFIFYINIIFNLEAIVNLSLKLFLGLISSFSMAIAAEQTIPASIDVVEEEAIPLDSSAKNEVVSTQTTLAPQESKKSTSTMVTQEAPSAQTTLASVPASSPQMVAQSKSEPIIIRVPAKRQQIVIEREKPAYETDVNELRHFYPITLNLAIAASLGSGMFLNSDVDMPDFSGITWNAGVLAIFPVNDLTIGMITGALFKSRSVSAILSESSDTRYRFSQMSIDVPLYFKFKSARSRLAFDFGIQMSVNIYDKLKISSGLTSDNEYDLLDASYRAPIDWHLLTGFSVFISSKFAFNAKFLLGFSDLYNTTKIEAVDTDFTSTEFTFGFQYNIF